MSLKSNISANYASQIYTTLIGIALIPVYLRTMGGEAYGLIGFFSVLQAWFNVLDLGLTPTISRESSRYCGGAISALDYRRIFRVLSIIFISTATAGGTVLFALAQTAAQHWLKLEALPISEVVTAVQIMSVCVALRWLGGLYRGVILGAERLVWLSIFNSIIATSRFVIVIPSMWLWGFTPKVFFWHQLGVAIFELLVLMIACFRLIPKQSTLGAPIGWSFRPVFPLLRFSISIGFTSTVWVLVTQSDRLILSGILPLRDYGSFALAVLVAGTVTLVSSPITTAIMPRMARLFAEGQLEEMQNLYGQSAQLVSVVAVSIAAPLVVCPESLIFAWGGDLKIAFEVAPVLRLYAIGNGLLALGAFPYYLQYARGNMSYHLLGNLLLVICLVPAIVLAAIYAGAAGAGWAWLTVNALYLMVWVAYVHGKLARGTHLNWLNRNVATIMLPTLAVAVLLQSWRSELGGRLLEGFWCFGLGAICLFVASMASPLLRSRVLRPFQRQII
jgi:O-antigen/teichoic acid export membrane protein